ncbi:AAA family ATPase [Rubrobacter indicoceani]|uniref:AAA family ATPase n=1 Tax=Rubrobacter indicoceani TaxID=2051957 RepID=UPI000E5A181F|nr:AAA family ATPase [Rubrobacter indicoceani]
MEKPVDDARTFSGLARRIRASAPRLGATQVVCVDGPSGSGKTTFAARLAAQMVCPTVHLDDLYPGWNGLADSTSKLVEWVLEPLLEHRPARYRRFNWDLGRYAEWHSVPECGTLIVEGVGSGAARGYPVFLIWVEAPRDLRMKRGIERDGEAFRPHWERWADQELRMFDEARTRERADLLVDGDPDTAHDPEREFFVLRA